MSFARGRFQYIDINGDLICIMLRYKFLFDSVSRFIDILVASLFFYLKKLKFIEELVWSGLVNQ